MPPIPPVPTPDDAGALLNKLKKAIRGEHFESVYDYLKESAPGFFNALMPEALEQLRGMRMDLTGGSTFPWWNPRTAGALGQPAKYGGWALDKRYDILGPLGVRGPDIYLGENQPPDVAVHEAAHLLRPPGDALEATFAREFPGRIQDLESSYFRGQGTWSERNRPREFLAEAVQNAYLVAGGADFSTLSTAEKHGLRGVIKPELLFPQLYGPGGGNERAVPGLGPLAGGTETSTTSHQRTEAEKASWANFQPTPVQSPVIALPPERAISTLQPEERNPALAQKALPSLPAPRAAPRPLAPPQIQSVTLPKPTLAPPSITRRTSRSKRYRTTTRR